MRRGVRSLSQRVWWQPLLAREAVGKRGIDILPRNLSWLVCLVLGAAGRRLLLALHSLPSSAYRLSHQAAG